MKFAIRIDSYLDQINYTCFGIEVDKVSSV